MVKNVSVAPTVAVAKKATVKVNLILNKNTLKFYNLRVFFVLSFKFECNNLKIRYGYDNVFAVKL